MYTIKEHNYTVNGKKNTIKWINGENLKRNKKHKHKCVWVMGEWNGNGINYGVVTDI